MKRSSLYDYLSCVVVKIARFLPNPEANWGPKARAGRGSKRLKVRFV